MKASWPVAALAFLVAGCASVPGNPEGCSAAPAIGRFEPSRDLLLAQFDIKTDVDDIHSAAALATMLAQPELECVEYLAVAGTYGTQGGDYVPADAVFDAAFGRNWRDAHSRRDAVVGELADQIIVTLGDGGDVWIMEAGQSDVSADALRLVLAIDPDAPVKTRVHIVQHSDWNESVTSPEDLAYVKAVADYVRIPDGNAVGNGSPGFNTPDGALWAVLLADPDVGDVWALARQRANEMNGVGYDNPSVRAGGLDFSDTAEAAWIFGFEEMIDAAAFAEVFLLDAE